jgi:hypothetical protein
VYPINSQTNQPFYKKGDKVYCKMEAYLDGESQPLTARSAPIIIQDTLPKITSVTLELNNGNFICKGNATDFDKDAITSAGYEFIQAGQTKDNGDTQCTKITDDKYVCEKEISKDVFSSTSPVSCTLIPFTGGLSGNKLESNPVTIQ